LTCASSNALSVGGKDAVILKLIPCLKEEDTLSLVVSGILRKVCVVGKIEFVETILQLPPRSLWERTELKLQGFASMGASVLLFAMPPLVLPIRAWK
jgi:hypothetical protein